MDKRRFLDSVKRLDLRQSVTITFTEDGMAGFCRLMGLLRNSPTHICIDSMDKAVCDAIIATQVWGGDKNRTIRVYGLAYAEPMILCEIAKDVEKIAVSDHGAKVLFTKREKTRNEAAKKIIAEVLSKNLVTEIQDWGLNISASVGEYGDGFPGIDFGIQDENELLTQIFLDGWSGRMMVNGIFGDQLFTRPQQLQELIRAELTKCLEELTT